MSDEQAKKLIEEISNCGSVEEFQALSKEKRTEALRILRANNLSYRQLSRLTGLSVGVIQRIL